MSSPLPVTPSGTGAGRGVLYIAFAKFYFLIVGMVIQFRLPVILSEAAWGAFSLVNSIASWFNNVAVTGTIQAVSRFAAQNPGQARAVQATGLRMHLRLGLPVAIAFIAGSPVIAWALGDPSKTKPLMLAGFIIGGYSFYAVFIGTANGLRLFHKQAGLDITFATLRAAGLLGMAIAGMGVTGVVGGWVGAVGLILCAAIAWVGLPRTSEKLPVRPMLVYFGKVAVYLLLFNGLMFVDTILLKRIVGDHYAGLVPELRKHMPLGGYKDAQVATLLTDAQVGFYAAAQNLGRVAYQAIIAATFVVFPLVSRSTFTDDHETTKRYVQVTARYSVMFAMAIAVVMAANPTDVLGLLYSPAYAERGSNALVFLAFGNVAFSMLAIAGTILNGAGKSRPAVVSAAITLAIAIIGNAIAISMYAGSPHVLDVAAAVTGGAMLIGAMIAAFQLQRHFGATMPLTSLVRILVATGVAFAVGRFLPLHGKLMTLVEAVIVAGVFLVVLVASRELGARDLQAIKAVRSKRGAGEGEP
ncbi:MAG: polysaccharide biosynthesis C-terminal domain-containing protein [Deltaproteobacteria bacterium]|nr:polysaccharide biosynthesis C-terminal domain-containing protein [Deltaproteobacteria bacterium]